VPAQQSGTPRPSASRTYIGVGVWDQAALQESLAALGERRRARLSGLGTAAGQTEYPAPAPGSVDAVAKAPRPAHEFEHSRPGQAPAPALAQEATWISPVPAKASPASPPPSARLTPPATFDAASTVSSKPAPSIPALAELHDSTGSPPPRPPIAHTSPPDVTAHRLTPVIAGVLVAIAAAGAAAYWLLDRTSPTPATTGYRTSPASTVPLNTLALATDSTQSASATSGADAVPSDTATAAAASDTASGPLTDPAQVVLEYFTAINNHDYTTAWNLGGDNLAADYTTFANGFQATSDDIATAQDTSATTAAVRLTAIQTDGTVQNYAGTYTVISGVITEADIQQTG